MAVAPLVVQEQLWGHRYRNFWEPPLGRSGQTDNDCPATAKTAGRRVSLRASSRGTMPAVRHVCSVRSSLQSADLSRRW